MGHHFKPLIDRRSLRTKVISIIMFKAAAASFSRGENIQAVRVDLGKRRAKQEKKESVCFSVRTVFSYEVRSVPQLTIL